METLVTLLISPFMMAWRGYVLSVMWGWFLVPLGAPSIGVVQAIGLSVLIAFLTVRTDLPTKEQTLLDRIASAIVIPAFGLAIGWLVHLFL